MRILQWNVWYKEKVENITTLLRQVDADVVCLQELRINHQNVPERIAKKCGMTYHFAPAQTYSGGEIQGNGIFSKHTITAKDSITVKKSEGKTPEAWDECRIIAVANIEIEGTIFKIATTHLSYTHKFEETEQKREEVANFITYIKRQSKNFILTGDLNVTPTSHTIKEIEKHLKHCGPSYDKPTWTTKPFSYMGFKETQLRWRLDYIFSTPDIEIASAEIVKTPFSDHLPIIVDLELRSSKRKNK